MRIPEVKPYVVKVYFSKYARQRALLFLGPSGVGKSVAVHEAAQEITKRLGKKFIKVKLHWKQGKWIIDNDSKDVFEVLNNPDEYFVLVDLRLSQVPPEDLSGIPRTVESISFYHPLAWVALLSICPGILFCDEFTQIERPDTESASYQLILDRMAGFVGFHDDVIVIGAGNRPEESKVAHLISAPLVNRFKIIRVDSPTVDQWREWMDRTYGDDWDRRCYAFLKRFETENYLLKPPKEAETLHQYPTPRSWTQVALEIKEGFVSEDDLCGLLGEEVGAKLAAFLALPIDIEDFIREPKLFIELNEKAMMREEKAIDSQYMVACQLGSWLSRNYKKCEKAFPLIDAMAQCSREWVVLTFMTTERKHLPHVLSKLFAYNKEYQRMLEEVVLSLKPQI